MAEPDQLSPSEPLVSVIIPFYKHSRYLKEALESAYNQTLRSTEIIVVDDGSTEDISDITVQYPNVITMRQAHSGLPAARNAGLRLSRGRFIIFHDADDLLLSHAIEIGLQEIAKHPDSGFVWGGYCFVDHDGRPIARPVIPKIKDDTYLSLLRGDYLIMISTVLYRRDILETIGGFDETLGANEDYELELRIARQFPVNCYRSVVAHYRRHGGNLSGNTRLLQTTHREVLDRQLPYLASDPRGRAAYKAAKSFIGQHYYSLLLNEARGRRFVSEPRGAALVRVLLVIWEAPWCCVKIAAKYVWRKAWQKVNSLRLTSDESDAAEAPFDP